MGKGINLLETNKQTKAKEIKNMKDLKQMDLDAPEGFEEVVDESDDVECESFIYSGGDPELMRFLGEFCPVLVEDYFSKKEDK